MYDTRREFVSGYPEIFGRSKILDLEPMICHDILWTIQDELEIMLNLLTACNSSLDGHKIVYQGVGDNSARFRLNGCFQLVLFFGREGVYDINIHAFMVLREPEKALNATEFIASNSPFKCHIFGRDDLM